MKNVTTPAPSLLREPTEGLPEGCYCQPGRCMAPVLMGRQMPCRDPQKAALASKPEPEPLVQPTQDASKIRERCGCECYYSGRPWNECDCGNCERGVGKVAPCLKHSAALTDSVKPAPEAADQQKNNSKLPTEGGAPSPKNAEPGGGE